jgi:hypothetical protein
MSSAVVVIVGCMMTWRRRLPRTVIIVVVGVLSDHRAAQHDQQTRSLAIHMPHFRQIPSLLFDVIWM